MAASIFFSSCSSLETRLISASPMAGNGGGGSCRGGFLRPSRVICPGQEGRASVQALLLQRQNSRLGMMTTVDHLKRLCIDHYFQEEINDVVHACMDLIHSDDMHEATLSFRLMREAGYQVSADEVLWKFTNAAGDFNLAHSRDIRALLSLHDISHMNMGEASLYKGKEFTRKHLTYAMEYLEPNLARYVRKSLDHPYHVSLMQYKARHHLNYLQSLPTRNTAMEELALSEFKLNKLLHQNEMQEIKRWWVDLGLSQEIPAARDQVLKWYMWSMTILQGPSYSKYRIEITKIISLVYIVDDIFDVVATKEELCLFTEAIKMWDLAAIDSLPRYMRLCYNALYTITNDVADMAEKEHGSNPIHHLKESWSLLLDGFMVEAKWLSTTNQVPAPKEYLSNGVATSGGPLLFVHLLFMLGHDAAKLTHEIPPVISCPAKIMRLWDDMGSAKDEAQEGLDGSYRELYLKQNPGGDAEEHMISLIEKAWEELNKECFSKQQSFPPVFVSASLNFARMIGVMYGYDEEQKLPILEDYIRMFLL